MFKENLKTISRGFSSIKKPKDIMYTSIQKRLDRSAQLYFEKLSKECSNIESKNVIKVLRAISTYKVKGVK